ncbi:MAG: protein kinase, partial [Planctomycetota bacterium]|nr:protein kinase [Planctomycetota bacterium]
MTRSGQGTIQPALVTGMQESEATRSGLGTSVPATAETKSFDATRSALETSRPQKKEPQGTRSGTDTSVPDSVVALPKAMESLVGEGTIVTLSDSRITVAEEVGKGGMGSVHRAIQGSLEREIAVKVPNSDLSIRQQFTVEAMANGFLEHPNIVPVYDYGEESTGEVLMAMKLVKGNSWKDLLHPQITDEEKKVEVLGQEDHLRTLIQVCNAIDFAHSKGIAHLDLKPHNVMIGSFGEVLVMDWGIALDFRSEEARGNDRARGFLKAQLVPGRPFGTVAYCAPELADGDIGKLGAQTDIYLLGAILHEILTDKPPHSGPGQALFRASESKPPQFPENVPDELQKVCRKAMAKRQEERFATVKELREALNAYLDHKASLSISQRAEDLLNNCAQSLSGGDGQELKAKERNQLNADFAEAVAGFKQALLAWPENSDAQIGEEKAREKYAEFAVSAGDMGLAEAQVSKLKPGKVQSGLLQRVVEAKKARSSVEKAAKRLRGTIIGAVLLVLVAVSAGCFFTYREWTRAEDREDVAVRERNKAQAAEKNEKAAKNKAQAAQENEKAAKEKAQIAAVDASSKLTEIQLINAWEEYTRLGDKSPREAYEAAVGA